MLKDKPAGCVSKSFTIEILGGAHPKGVLLEVYLKRPILTGVVDIVVPLVHRDPPVFVVTEKPSLLIAVKNVTGL